MDDNAPTVRSLDFRGMGNLKWRQILGVEPKTYLRPKACDCGSAFALGCYGVPPNYFYYFGATLMALLCPAISLTALLLCR